MQSPFCVGHNGAAPGAAQPLSPPACPSLGVRTGPPLLCCTRAWWRVSRGGLSLSVPQGSAHPSLLPAPALELLQAVRLALAALCRGRDPASKFSLMKRLYFLFRALLPAVMAPALPPAPQGFSALPCPSLQHPCALPAGGGSQGVMSSGAEPGKGTVWGLW